MAKESTQHKLDRVRSPRVHITYDVEIGDAIEMKELPFVMGVLGDLTGQPEQPLAALKDRKFVEINPDNFDTVLKGMQPHLAFSVANKLSDDPSAGQISVDLHFESMDDFSPGECGQPSGSAEGTARPADAACPICAEACRATTNSTKRCSRRFRTPRRAKSFAQNWAKSGGERMSAHDGSSRGREVKQASETVSEQGLLDQIVAQGRFTATRPPWSAAATW